MKRRFLSLCIVSTTVAVTTAYAADPFQNGSFENIDNTFVNQSSNPIEPYDFLNPGSTAITGWQTSGGVVPWVRGGAGYLVPVENGDYALYLESPGTTISQTFATTGGTTYDVSFWASTFSSPQTLTTGIEFGNGGHTQEQYLTIPGNGADRNYYQYSFQFTTAAGTSESTLSFIALSANGTDYMDNVSVAAATPEPSSFLAVGLGLGVLSIRRKRKHSRMA